MFLSELKNSEIHFLGKLEFLYGSKVAMKDNQQFENSSRIPSESDDKGNSLFQLQFSNGCLH